MEIFGYQIKPRKIQKKSKPVDATKEKVKVLPPGPIAKPDSRDIYDFMSFNGLKIVKPTTVLELIPIIRSLYKTNSDMGSVMNDLVRLTNTGHHIKFDQSTDATLADKMRAHLQEASKKWGISTPNIDGIVNKLITQIWVSGCISAEAVPNNRLFGLEKITLINPENTVWTIDKRGRYTAYQKTNRFGLPGMPDMVKLNPDTYTYITVLGDEDNPYTIPPFLTALESLATQKDMKTNINHILKQAGLLGYLEARVGKPDQQANESDTKYSERLTTLLRSTKENIQNGFMEGVVVGFDEDHEFEFHSTTKNLNNVDSIYNLNQQQVANGLKQPGSFLGLNDSGGEGQLGIVFTKMLSQLKNVQDILSVFLVKIYTLELIMAGYDFKTISVVFNKSTITDDLKLQQAREIKQRVLHSLWVDRIIGSEVYAEEMEYQKPFKVIEPPLPGEEAGSDAKKKEDREKGKDKSDRKSRDKNKDQPKRKDTETKPR